MGHTEGVSKNRLAPLLTVEQVSRLLQLHPNTVYRLVRRSRLPFVRIGRSIRFDRAEIASVWRSKP